MSKRFQAVRGMNDILPAETPGWQQVEGVISTILKEYGYHEIRLPLLEDTAVFARSIGTVTDIVQKEMYTFDDRNGDSLTLRPEGTAGCVRAVIEHGMLQRPSRMWYLGPMFRHERPQKGRYRQFYQVGVECFGMPGPDIDAEMLLLSARLWARLGVDDLVRLEINTLGTADSRREHRAVLQQYFRENLHALDDDSRNRLEKNPLRILDSKNPDLDALIKNAPPMDQYLDDESSAHFDRICSVLSAADVAFTINPRLVRGLDYYCKTVFEWKTDQLGAQGTVCAGGRYDGLVELMGGRSTPAVGFALGLERLVELRRIAGGPFEPRRADVYVISTHEEYTADALLLSEDLRSQLEGRVVVCHCGGGSLKSQMKKADRSQAAVAILIGEEEHRSNTVAIKPLWSDEAQRSADIGDCAAAVRPYLS